MLTYWRLETEGGGLGAGPPHCHCLKRSIIRFLSECLKVEHLLVGIGACLGVSEGSGDLAVLGQVEGGDLHGLLDLLLVGLHLKFIDVQH